MRKKTLLVLVNIFLILTPTFPVMENFYLTVDYANFSGYLLGCGIISILIILAALFIRYKNHSVVADNPKILLGTWLLFSLGILVMVPLHMGPPKEGPSLLQSATEEKFRYVMLLVAVMVFAIGIILLIKPFWSKMSLFDKAIIIISSLIAIPISIWDYYDSYTFSDQLTAWVNAGKNVNDFFPNFDFHHNLRAIGRILPYVVAAWLSIILYKQAIIKKWVVIVVSVFCLIGVGFCITFITKGFAFYFPFMVPAIALSPAYWLGIALLNKTTLKQIA